MRRFAPFLYGLLLLAPLHSQELMPSRMMPLAPQSLISSLYVNGDELWAVGNRGHFFRWEDGLIQEPFPAQQFLCDIAVQGQETWVVGHDSLIMYRPTPDAPWKPQYYDPDLESPLMAVRFKDSQVGMAVGAYGLVLITEDGGKNWRKLPIPEDEPHFFQVKTDSEGNWYLAGEFGYILKLAPNGDILKKYDPGLESTFFGIEVFAPDRWLAYGLRGRLVYFDGQKVTQLESPRSSGLFSSLSLMQDTLIFGSAGSILLYRDGIITDRSLDTRIPILDAQIRGSTLVLATAKGLIQLPIDEVLP